MIIAGIIIVILIAAVMDIVVAFATAFIAEVGAVALLTPI
jgi:hypothetical protein